MSSLSLPPLTKEQRIQVYALASLYKFKKNSVGKGTKESTSIIININNNE